MKKTLISAAMTLIFISAACSPGSKPAALAGPQFAVSFPPALSAQALDGRLLLMLSNNDKAEPRFQVSDGASTQLIFGIDVEGMAPGAAAVIDASVFGYPLKSLADVPPGDYYVQALLNRYETFVRADGHTVKLPPDKGEGQVWNRKPGNLYSEPKKITIASGQPMVFEVALDKEIPPIAPPADTKYIKHVKIQSELLTKFWGRPMEIGACILLPEGFDTHPNARYPLIVNHGHFPYTLEGFRETPPDPDLKPDYSERFQLEGYNRIQQEYAYQFYKDWTGPKFPRVILIEIQHANPYYDDSYAVNSANLGPYGDAIVKELIPYIEQKFRGLGAGLGPVHVRRLDRRLGSAGRPGLLPRRFQRLLRRLPRPDRLPGLYGRRHLQPQERLLRRFAMEENPAAGHAQLPWRSLDDARTGQSFGSGSGEQGPVGRPMGHLAGRLQPGRRRRISQADLGQDRPE